MTFYTERWYEMVANKIYGMGKVKLDHIHQHFPELTREQVLSALNNSRKKGLVVHYRHGNEYMYEAPLRAPNSVWQLPAHI